MYLYHTTAPLARVRPHKATCHKKRSGELTPVATDTQTPYRRASPQVTVSRPRRSALFRVQRQCCEFSRAERRALTCAAHIRSSYAPHHPLGGASEASSSAKGATAALAAICTTAQWWQRQHTLRDRRRPIALCRRQFVRPAAAHVTCKYAKHTQSDSDGFTAAPLCSYHEPIGVRQEILDGH